MNFEKCTLQETKRQLTFFLFFRATLKKEDAYFLLCSEQINDIILHNPKLKELDILNLQIKVKNFIDSI